MAGIFDLFNPQDPMKQQGLLAAAAAMLQGAGDPRKPFGFGDALGGGIGAYQQSMTQQQQTAQQQALRDLQIKSAQGELDDQDLARKHKQAISDAASASNMTAEQQAMAGGGGPTLANADKIATSKGGFDLEGFANRMMAIDPMQGIELMQKLKKAGPKFDSGITFVNGPDGKPMAVRTADDGSIKQLDGVTPREKLQFLNTGGKTLGVNDYTGEQVASFANTATAGDLLSAATQRRGQDITMRGQNLTDARAREASANSANKDKAPTEFQGKSAAYALRATEADRVLQQLHDAPATGFGMVAPDRPSAIKGALSSVPLIGSGLGTLANWAPTWAGGTNANQQRAEQAQRDFVNAVLRQESGAAIGQSEFDNARQQYFPQAGDSDQVVAQKARSRQLAIQGLQANAGKFGLTAPPVAPAGNGIKFLGFE